MKDERKNWGTSEFQRIRRYLSPIYLYGARSRVDIAKSTNTSKQNYDTMLGLLRPLMGENEKRSVHFFHRNYHRNGKNPVANAYMFRAMDHNKVMIEYLHILSRLRKSDAKREDLKTVFEINGIITDPKTIDSRAKSLLDYGVLRKQKGTYSLCPNYFRKLSHESLRQLADYVSFSSSITYPRAAGSFLCRNLERELHARGMELPKESPFLLRHNSYHNCLDEELLYQLMELIPQHQYVMFDDKRCLPIRVRVDVRLGRWYVHCLNEEGDPCVEKLTNTKEITKIPKEKAVTEDFWEQAVLLVEDAYKHTLVSGYHREPVLVKAKLDFGDALGIRKQFLREISIGEVVVASDGEYYEAWVSDPLELKPLLRAYGPYLHLISSGPKNLREILADDYKKMLEALDSEVSL